MAAVVPAGATLAVRTDETAAVWALALPAGSPSPSAADVAAAAAAVAAAAAAAAAVASAHSTSSSGAAAAAAIASATSTSSALLGAAVATAVADTWSAGAGVGATLQAPLTLTLTGLTPATRYDVYVVARDFRPPGTDGLATDDPELGVMQGRPTRVLVVTPPASASLVSLAPSVGRAGSMILTTSHQSPQFQPFLVELNFSI